MKRRVDDSDHDSDHNNDRDRNEVTQTASPLITCTITPCWKSPPSFHNYEQYALHVHSMHSNICNQCKKKFPTHNFLLIHIEENHDPFFQIKREHGERIYKCFNYSTDINGCHKICHDRHKRRLHMIDKHGYPRDFNFRMIDFGI